MRYGYFDDKAREYVTDRVDVPVSFTNYLGTQRMGAVISHNAGGYCWLDTPQYHRITRFRPNGVPMDWPGHYVYLRDDRDGDYWSLSWQPVGKPLDQARYAPAHFSLALHQGGTEHGVGDADGHHRDQHDDHRNQRHDLRPQG